jgi:hypothetical protein
VTTTTTCPNGHPSASSDYCDTCGAPIGESPTPVAKTASGPGLDPAPSSPVGANADQGESGPASPSSSATTQACPNCATVNTADALFCEECGYDFTTGTMPRAEAEVSSLDLGTGSGAGNLDTGAQPSTAAESTPPSVAPAVKLEWVAEIWVDPDWYAEQESDEPCPSPGLPVVVPLRAQSLLIGRTSRSRNIHPEIECSSDVGVSRRQAQLTTDGQRWWIEDLQSSNGTYVGAASAAVPTEPLPAGQRRELAPDDRIYVGAWTGIVIRRATPEEQSGQA